ncbi:MAG: regulatory protein RecX [Rhodoluna sp.]
MAFEKRAKSGGSHKRSPDFSVTEGTKKEKKSPTPERLEQRARNVLLHQLARSAKSTHQLRQILEKREIPSEIAERVLERFTEVGLIDDAAYAETIVNSRRNIKGLSKSAIKRELNDKGVPSPLIEVATEAITSEDDLVLAQELAGRRIRQMTNLAAEVRHRRLVGYLGRKGFSSAVVFAAIRFAESNRDDN